MKRIVLLFAAVALVAIAAKVPVSAHHSFAATYDEEREQKVEGDLVAFLFRNPHSFVRVMAREARRLNSLVIRGAEPEPDFKPTSTAVKRLINDKITFSYADEPTGSGDFFQES